MIEVRKIHKAIGKRQKHGVHGGVCRTGNRNGDGNNKIVKQ